MPKAHNVYFSTLGGLCGALALIFYAISAHSGSEYLSIIAPILLAHAPTFLVLSLLAARCSAATYGGTAIFIGLLLFCGDLLCRHFWGQRLFPFAAPIGGLTMIFGWLIISFAGWSNCQLSEK